MVHDGNLWVLCDGRIGFVGFGRYIYTLGLPFSLLMALWMHIINFFLSTRNDWIDLLQLLFSYLYTGRYSCMHVLLFSNPAQVWLCDYLYMCPYSYNRRDQSIKRSTQQDVSMLVLEVDGEKFVVEMIILWNSPSIFYVYRFLIIIVHIISSWLLVQCLWFSSIALISSVVLTRQAHRIRFCFLYFFKVRRYIYIYIYLLNVSGFFL